MQGRVAVRRPIPQRRYALDLTVEKVLERSGALPISEGMLRFASGEAHTFCRCDRTAARSEGDHPTAWRLRKTKSGRMGAEGPRISYRDTKKNQFRARKKEGLRGGL